MSDLTVVRKEEWIESWTAGKFSSVNKEVITFIANVLYHCPNEPWVVHSLFASGYCYYFANMLKLAFNRGQVVWHKGYSHILWLDIDDTAYDISGVFCDYNDGDLVPVEELGKNLSGFKHV